MFRTVAQACILPLVSACAVPVMGAMAASGAMGAGATGLSLYRMHRVRTGFVTQGDETKIGIGNILPEREAEANVAAAEHCGRYGKTAREFSRTETGGEAVSRRLAITYLCAPAVSQASAAPRRRSR